MEDFNGTPGKWTASCYMVTADNGRQVTHVGLLGRRRASRDGQDGGVEDECNAQLIAAAPDLLAALLGVLKVADRKTAEFDAAIAKALGQEGWATT